MTVRDPSSPGGAESPPATYKIVLAFAAVYLIWGSTYLAIRFAVETLPPFLMAATRFLVAGALLYLVKRRGTPAPGPRHWAFATLTGGLMLCGGNGGVVWAQQFVASGLAALLVATVPLWMVLFDALRPAGRRPGPLTAAGLLLGFVAVWVLVEPDRSMAEGGLPWAPALVLLAASASWAAGSLLSRNLRVRPGLGIAMQMLGGGALLLALGAATGELARVDLAGASVRSLAGLGYLIAFGSLVGYTSYLWLLRVAPADRVATYAFVNPVVAVLLGWLLASEPLTPRVGVATVLVVAAVAAVVAGRRAAPRASAGGSTRPVQDRGGAARGATGR